jgi:hypothetical protein
MSNESNSARPWWLSWEKVAASDSGSNCVDHESWRTDSHGWTLLDSLPNLPEPADTGHNFLADTAVEYSIRIDRADVERVLGVPLTTADWRSVAVHIDTGAMLSAREMFAGRLATAWLRHLACESNLNTD